MTEGLFFSAVVAELVLASTGLWILAFRRTGCARTIPLVAAFPSFNPWFWWNPISQLSLTNENICSIM